MNNSITCRAGGHATPIVNSSVHYWSLGLILFVTVQLEADYLIQTNSLFCFWVIAFTTDCRYTARQWSHCIPLLSSFQKPLSKTCFVKEQVKKWRAEILTQLLENGNETVIWISNALRSCSQKYTHSRLVPPMVRLMRMNWRLFGGKKFNADDIPLFVVITTDVIVSLPAG